MHLDVIDHLTAKIEELDQRIGGDGAVSGIAKT